MKKSERDELRARWDVKQPLDAGRSPFGVTSEGYQDLRGVPLNDFAKVLGRQFLRCDLSYSDLSEIYLQKIAFADCKFGAASFAGFTDSKNRFENCLFLGCSFVGSAIGIRTSSYGSCVFEGCDFRNAVFANAVFRDCQFRDNRLKEIDFNACGFWKCAFIGDLTDVTFRGDYLTAMERKGQGPPQSTGLHEVDFRAARLSWISLTSGCVLDRVQMPGKHPAVICRLRTMLADFDEAFGKALTPDERIAARQFLSAGEPWAEAQDLHILSLGDLIEDCGEKVGNLLFEYAMEHRG